MKMAAAVRAQRLDSPPIESLGEEREIFVGRGFSHDIDSRSSERL
jgi:hypothetical protein